MSRVEVVLEEDAHTLVTQLMLRRPEVSLADFLRQAVWSQLDIEGML